QRQRIALARALLARAPILVLDEPTSALDPLAAQRVRATLQTLRGRRTIILVTHELECAAVCDRIFVLNRGHLHESGTHTDLLRRNGAYAELQRATSDAAVKF